MNAELLVGPKVRGERGLLNAPRHISRRILRQVRQRRTRVDEGAIHYSDVTSGTPVPGDARGAAAASGLHFLATFLLHDQNDGRMGPESIWLISLRRNSRIPTLSDVSDLRHESAGSSRWMLKVHSCTVGIFRFLIKQGQGWGAA